MMRGVSLQFLGDGDEDSHHVEVRADGGTASEVIDTYVGGEELLEGRTAPDRGGHDGVDDHRLGAGIAASR